jgi:uncharacterized membrane protein YjjP (DUF1212 family)
MFFVNFGMNTFASACAGASFAVLSNLRDAVLASVFVITAVAVLVHRIVTVHNHISLTEL